MGEFSIKKDVKGYHVFLDITGDYMFTTDDDIKADRIIKALEKQISKKPIRKPGVHSGHWLCPTCNRTYWEKKELDGHCVSCGQRFDLK